MRTKAGYRYDLSFKHTWVGSRCVAFFAGGTRTRGPDGQDKRAFDKEDDYLLRSEFDYRKYQPGSLDDGAESEDAAVDENCADV